VLASASVLIRPGEPVRAQVHQLRDITPKRVVHHFDFDERAEGNLEDLPKYWESLRPRGFPHYAKASFDWQVGRSAPPSFHLMSEGRNVAYQYLGPDTRVRADTDYRIEGFIRADGLEHARACLTGHFLDKAGRPLPETLVRSRFVGGAADRDRWVRVELFFADAPVEAHTIGLIGWVVQRSVWNLVPPPLHHIPRTDVRGGAWFDDITVYALPRVQVTTGTPGNVLAASDQQVLRVLLADDDGSMLDGTLSITDADGKPLEVHSVPAVVGENVDPRLVGVGHLPPGLYYARLDVHADDRLIVSRELRFARLAPWHRDIEALARSFGVVVDPRSRSHPEAELALLQRQMVRSAKVPVWTGLPGPRPTHQERRAEDRLFQALVRDGFALTGVLFGPPRELARSRGSYVPTLVELLSGDPAVWKEHLTTVVAPNASSFHWWQIGPDRVDRDLTPIDEDRRATAAAQVRDVMRPFVMVPRLAVPVSTTVEPAEDRTPVQQVSLALGRDLRPDLIGEKIAAYRRVGYKDVCVYVEPLPEGLYRRQPRLADWAQRVITARHAGADAVFVPQTWRVRTTVQGPVTEPLETYLVLRTIADVLGDAEPGKRVWIDGGVECLAFEDAETDILALWDPAAPPGGSRYAIQLGQADRQIDLWGVPTSLARDDTGRQIVHLSSMPVLIPNVARWLIDFRTSFALRPDHVECGTEQMQHRVEMASGRDRVMAGRIVFEVPEAWDISPRVFSFSVAPPDPGSYPVEIRYPHSEPAGEKTILARITLTGERYYEELPLPIDVGVSDLDAWGLAVVEQDDLVLRHVVTNRSSDVLNLRSSANVPGRERQYRPISNLRPGDTQTVDYHFNSGRALIGRSIRLVLREMNDGPRVHTLELSVP
jgi:hypothetical protein